jgi:hypothetical protein
MVEKVALVSLAYLLLASGPTWAGTCTFTEDAYIGPDDTTCDGEDVIVNGCILTVDGTHSFNSLQIIYGGVVTHSPGPPDGMHLIIAEDVTIDSSGYMEVDGRGYPSATGPGKGADGANYGGGGAHGGAGGVSRNDEAIGGTPYDLITQPMQFGSGGGMGGSDAVGGAGGGLIEVTVYGTLTIDGHVTANGTDGGQTFDDGGGGSGGSIRLTAGTLSGAGVIAANGGAGSRGNGGGGAGGRIAIYYGTEMFWGDICACGGNGHEIGGAGTVFLKSSGDSHGRLFIDNCALTGAATPLLDEMYVFDSLDVSRAGRLQVHSGTVLSAFAANVHNDGELIVGGTGDIDFQDIQLASGGTFTLNKAESLPSLWIDSGGLLTHSPTLAGFDLTIAGDLMVASGGYISVDGKGYPSATGPGKGADGANYGAGAGYGGAGGDSRNGEAEGGSPYGSETEPTHFGSGGGMGGSDAVGGAGGGAIRLTVTGTLMIDGHVTANGTDGGHTFDDGGGGSGGSIYLTVNTLSGEGVIAANGGAGAYGNGGGGGAGRVAIYYCNLDFPETHVEALGGEGWQNGEDGTVHLAPRDDCGPPGDLNGDGCVDLTDLAELLSNYGAASGMSYADGDIDGDADVDLADLTELLAHYGEGCP